MLAFYFASDWFGSASLWLKDHFGMPGIGLLVFLVDCIPNVFSSDVVFAFTQGWNIPLLLAVMSVASILGGVSGFYLARLLGKTKGMQKLVSGYLSKGKVLIHKYGTLAIILAALTPIPYAHTCWIAGMMELEPKKVWLGSLFRIPRMILYYLAISGGLHLISTMP